MQRRRPLNRKTFEGLVALDSIRAQETAKSLEKLRKQARKAVWQKTSYSYLTLYKQVSMGKDPERLRAVLSVPFETRILVPEDSSRPLLHGQLIERLFTQDPDPHPLLKAAAFVARCHDRAHKNYVRSVEKSDSETRTALVGDAVALLHDISDIRPTAFFKHQLAGMSDRHVAATPRLHAIAKAQISTLWTANDCARLFEKAHADKQIEINSDVYSSFASPYAALNSYTELKKTALKAGVKEEHFRQGFGQAYTAEKLDGFFLQFASPEGGKPKTQSRIYSQRQEILTDLINAAADINRGTVPLILERAARVPSLVQTVDALKLRY